MAYWKAQPPGAAWGGLRFPVAPAIQLLPLDEPVAGPCDGRLGCRIVTTVDQGHGTPGGIPYRRNARLAVGRAVVTMDNQLLDRAQAGLSGWMILGIAEQDHRFVAIDHRRENRPQAVFAIHARQKPGLGLADSMLTQRFRHPAVKRTSKFVQSQENAVQQATTEEIVALLLRRSDEQLADVHSLGVGSPGLERTEDRQGHQGGPRPVGHLFDMDWRPARQQHDFDRQIGYGTPGDLLEHRQ